MATGQKKKHAQQLRFTMPEKRLIERAAKCEKLSFNLFARKHLADAAEIVLANRARKPVASTDVKVTEVPDLPVTGESNVA